MQKIPLVVVADAVVYPWAVMIHLEDAPIAGRAVMASVGFVALAEFAVFYPFVELGLLGGVVSVV